MKKFLLCAYNKKNICFTLIVSCFFLLSLPQTSYSQNFPNPSTLSTGQGPTGTVDPIWTVSDSWTATPPTNTMGLNYTTALINYNCAPGAWVDAASLPPPVNNGNWITGGDANCATNTGAGYRVFRLTLNLPADCNGYSVTTPGAYTLSFSGYVDNQISNVFINGNPTGISGGSYSAGSQLDFTLTGPWQVGTNFVDVVVYNFPNGGGANPYGLLLVANANSPTDTDGDGVPNIDDLCPCTPGNNAVGCMDPANPNNCNINQIRQALTSAGNEEMVSCVDACSMYFLNHQSMTGSQAQAYARTFGANLVSVESQAENNCITSSLNAMGQSGVVWIGLSDEVTEGTFVWYDQAPVVYTNWAPGEPNQAGDEDCVQIYANGTWNDLPCNSAGAKSIIEVNLCPVVNAGNDVSICSTATANLQAANTILGSSPYTYQWSNGPTTQANPVSPNTTTTYTLTSSDRYNCVSTDQVQVTVRPLPVITPITNIDACPQSTVNVPAFASNVSGTTYTWTNSNTAVGLAASGNGNITAFTATNPGTTPITSTISVTPTADNCVGPVITFTITVRPTTIVTPIAPINVCNGAPHATVVLQSPVAGTVFAWTNSNTTNGIPASGNGDIPAFTATNNTNAPITTTITVNPSFNGCPGTPYSFNIIINPTPTVDPIAPQTYCHGVPSSLTIPSGPVTGTTYTWTNSNTIIGLGASGSGNIPVFTTFNDDNSTYTGTVTVTPTANSCAGTPSTYTITVNPVPTVDVIADQTLCNGETSTQVVPDGDVSGSTFTWTNSNSNIGLAANGNGAIPAFNATNTTNAAVTSTITVTPTANACVGTPRTFNITVNPTPTLANITPQTYCPGTITGIITPTPAVTGTTYTWVNDNTNIGLGGSGTGDIPSFTATNPSSTEISATVTFTPTANGCIGTDLPFVINISPTPTVNIIADQIICNGLNSTAVTPTDNIGTSTYSWTNDNPSIGLAASGNGTIPAFTAINTGNTPVFATITVTPSANSCIGTPLSYTITINPTPITTAINNQTWCNGTSVASTQIQANLTGTTFTWANDNTSIGLAASGNGDVPSFTAANTTSAPILSNISIIPTADGCVGTATNYTITINPTPTVDPVTPQTLCNGDAITAISFIETVTGTTFDWTNDETSIGLPATGTGDIAVFNAVNNTSAIVTANITVTPSANGCTGASETFTITVNPTPTVDPITPQTLCNGDAITAIGFVETVTGTTFDWTNDEPSIGLPATGAGDIAAFNAVNNTSAIVTANITVTPSVNGCTGASETFSITVNPTPTVAPITPQTLCNGDAITAIGFVETVTGTTFDWTNDETSIGLPATGAGDIAAFNAVNNTSGIVTANITVTPSANGCTGASETFTITVNPTPTVDPITPQTLCNGDAITAIGFVETVTGTTFDWTNDEPSIGLPATGAGDIAAFNAVNNTSGIVTANITVTPSANGCTGASETFTITVNPTYIGTPVPVSICNGDSYTFGGQIFGTTGNFPVVFQSVNGCDSTVTLELTVNPTYDIVWPQTICAGASINFAGTTYNTSGNYPFTFQSINGCDSTVTLNLTVAPNPSVVINPQVDQCFNGNNFNFSLAQTFAPGSTTNWTFTGANTTTSSSSAPQGITYPTAGQYTVVVDVVENSCQSQGTLVINVLDQPIAQFNVNPPLGCIPFDVQFTNLTQGGGSLLWNFGGGTPGTSTASSPIIRFNNSGQFSASLTVTYPNGCSDTETANNIINAQAPPTAGFSIKPNEINIDNPTTMFIDGSSGASSVYYYVGDFAGVTGPTTPYTFTEEGTYQVMQVVTSLGGCTDTTYGQIVVTGNTEVFIPNAFTPNDDELNSRFKVYGNGFTDFHIMIYNRWGELLFESHDENLGWDGNFRGKPLRPEVYVYKVELNDFRNSPRTYIGSVTLIR